MLDKIEKENKKNIKIGNTKDKGKTYFAKRNFEKGELVFTFNGSKNLQPNDYTVPIGKGLFLTPTEYGGKYTNDYGLKANLGIQDRTKLIAIRNIKKGEEIGPAYFMFVLSYQKDSTADKLNLTSFVNINKKTKEKYHAYISDYLFDKKEISLYKKIPKIMKSKTLQPNEFHDISRFPATEGMLLFGISMAKINTSQNPQNCFSYIDELVKKIHYPYVGLTFIYSDSLYLYNKPESKKDYNTLDKKIRYDILRHKTEFTNILNKNKWYIQSSFNYVTWNQTLLEAENFENNLHKIKKIYDADKNFQKYVKEDIKKFKNKFNKENIDFILEEILVFYLATKGKIKFPNQYVNGKEKWVLWCYPGKPLKSEIYLYQKNFLNLKNPSNPYEYSFYDLSDKKLYNYKNIDLESINLN
ncbi:MAG: hypothetical protein PHQ18_01370 [Patescibacteria group bacterium]|nr:hypothetical protein [Patescibacteria group bacterium]